MLVIVVIPLHVGPVHSHMHPAGTSNDSDICKFSKVSDYNGGL